MSTVPSGLKYWKVAKNRVQLVGWAESIYNRVQYSKMSRKYIE